jgi:hypothetical protein
MLTEIQGVISVSCAQWWECSSDDEYFHAFDFKRRGLPVGYGDGLETT